MISEPKEEPVPEASETPRQPCYGDSKKGFDSPKVQRANREKFMTLEEVQELLRKVVEMKKPNWRRDHAAIFCGFFFGLRCSEACILCRECFRDLKYGQVHIRTKKQGQRIKFTCPECKRRYRVSATRIGSNHECSHCGMASRITLPAGSTLLDTAPPEKSPPVVETAVQAYVESYLEKLRPDQTWLFESAPGRPLRPSQMRKIFCFYLIQTKLNRKYSWHALRHGRGVMIMDKFEDLVMVRDSLRQKSLSAAEFYVNLSPKKQAAYRDALDKVVGELDLGID